MYFQKPLPIILLVLVFGVARRSPWHNLSLEIVIDPFQREISG